MNGAQARRLASELYSQGKPVIRINGIDSSRGKWYRKMKKMTDSRVGPWWFAEYEVLNQWLWDNAKASLYFPSNNDREVLHVGETGNKFKDRWRISPAISHETNRKIPDNQLFYTTGRPSIENEHGNVVASFPYEVRVVSPAVLRPLFEQWSDGELPNESEAREKIDSVYVKQVEKELRKYRAQVRNDVGRLFEWNKR